jgi:hypothetical protein
MNIKLQHVVSDLTGVTGMAIIRAILAGERDPVTLARLRDYRCQQSEETSAKALYGQWREEHLFALAQALALYEVYHQKMLEGWWWQAENGQFGREKMHTFATV